MATWKIESMIVKPQDGSHSDVVVTAAWRCSASDGDKTASNYGSMGFASPGDDFVAYPDLTEEEVLGWVWAGACRSRRACAPRGRWCRPAVPPIGTWTCR